MAIHNVAPGDCISSICREGGFHRWQTVWSAPENAAIRALRPNPNQLVAGDVVVLPAKQPRTAQRPTGARHTAVIATQPTYLRLFLRLDEAVDWELTLDDGKQLVGHLETDPAALPVGPEGQLVASISPSAQTATLRLWPTRVPPDQRTPDNALLVPLELGQLEPVETLRGVQGRLRNLGDYAGPLDGLLTTETAEALRRFRARSGLPEAPGVDAPLRAALGTAHGS
jgi:hypothetical protein